MKTLKFIAIVTIATCFLASHFEINATNKATPKTQYTKQTYKKSTKKKSSPVVTKEYKVPGSAVIGYAKQHGYDFLGILKSKGTNAQKKGACKFVGNHWQISRNASCTLDAFMHWGNVKCRDLRKGWKIKKVEINGSFKWNPNSGMPVNTSKAMIRLNSENKSRPTYPVSIKTITLIGPKGPFNKWQEAYSHCSDPNYRP